MAFIFGLVAVLAAIGIWVSGIAVALTFFSAFAVWLSSFLSTPLFQNADTLWVELAVMCGWSILSWVICLVLTFICGIMTVSRT